MDDFTNIQNYMTEKKRHNISGHRMPDSNAMGVFVKHISGKNEDSRLEISHYDSYYIIGLLLRGEAVLSLDFNEITLAQGYAVVIEPSQVHSGVSSGDDAEGWLLGLNPEHLTCREQEAVTRFCLQNKALPLPYYVVEDLRHIFEIYVRNEAYPSVLLSLAASVKGIVLANMAESNNGGNNRYSFIVVRLKTLLDANFRQIRNPGKYASMLNISEVYLNEAVKFVTCLSVSRFIRHYIVVQAKRLLVYTDMPAQEIAYRLGFEDYSYFSRLFKKEEGMSPNKFLKNLRLSK